MARARPLCRQCGKAILWKQNQHGNWVPYDPPGEVVHWETCLRRPAEQTPLWFKEKIQTLNNELTKSGRYAENLKHELARSKEEYRLSEEYLQYLSMSVTQVLNTAKSWHRATLRETGASEVHIKKLSNAVAHFIERETSERKRKLDQERKESRERMEKWREDERLRKEKLLQETLRKEKEGAKIKPTVKKRDRAKAAKPSRSRSRKLTRA